MRCRVALAVLMLLPVAAHAQDVEPFDPAVGVDDLSLGEARGGFLLPGGLDVSLAIASTTTVNGATVLRTILSADRALASLSVQAAAGSGVLQALSPGGTSFSVSGGTVRVAGDGANTRVTLDTAELDVTHLVGQTIGSIASNRGNDVAVDTTTNVNIVLSNATALNLGSAMLRIDGIATDAAARTVR